MPRDESWKGAELQRSRCGSLYLRLSQSSLRSRILVSTMLLSIAPLCIMSYQGYHCARQAVLGLTHSHILSMVDARAQVARSWLDERERNIRGLAVSPEIAQCLLSGPGTRAVRQASVQAALESFQRNNTLFESIALFDLGWETLADTEQEDHEPDDYLDASFQQALAVAEGVYFGSPHLHEIGGVGLHVGSAVRDAEGRAAGFIVANLNLTNSLEPLMQNRTGLYETGKAFIASPRDGILTAPFRGERRESIGREAPPAVFQAPAHAGERQSERLVRYEDYKGHRVLGAASPLPIYDWVLVVEIDESEALQWLHVLMSRAVATGIITLCLVFGVAILLARVMTRPLRELVRVAHRIRSGQWDERAPSLGSAEGEEVRQAFNLMMDELRTRQDQLVRAATLASVGELTSSIVHEMRNPLSSIKINCQALASRVRDDSRLAELGQITMEQIERLDSMLTDLLQFGRPVTLSVEPATFEELMEQILCVVDSLPGRASVDIRIENVLPGECLSVDREQMCRALTNAIKNAVEAVDGNGRIVIRARRDSGARDFACIDIEDNGPGMSEEALRRVFEPFFTTKAGGTGLGLPNMKKIVELHGGRIAVTRGASGGTRVSFTVPLWNRSPVRELSAIAGG